MIMKSQIKIPQIDRINKVNKAIPYITLILRYNLR